MVEFDVEILESFGDERCWFQDLLEDQGIPFHVERDIVWGASDQTPKFEIVQKFYVNHAYEAALRQQIEEFNSQDSLAQEALDEMDGQPDELPQVVCPNCGKSYDLDYPRCPYCKR